MAQASACAGENGAGRFAVARKIGDEDAKILVGKFLCVEGHHFFVGGEAVKENDRADGCAASRFVHVGDHVAAARA